MNAFALARELRKLHFNNGDLGQWWPAHSELQRHTVADACVLIDPACEAGFPSSNRNRVQFLGAEQTVTPEQLDEIIELYRSQNINRFFFWLSPGPQSEEIADWLQAKGLEVFGGTGYPTLIRDASPPEARDTTLTIRCVSPEEAPALLATKNIGIFGENPDNSVFMRTLGVEDVYHFLAFDRDDIAASAMLQVNGEFAYLLNASTLEAYRGRGAQSALIETRIQYALGLGCTTLASETLYMLETSLGNLQRAGFEIIYDKQVWVWNR